jgi:hypothetical protein
MKFNFYLLTALFMACFASAASQQLAFSTAEGFGKYAWGGRGGKVYIVSNLFDSGKGSLREAIEAKGSRIVLFAVDGTIELASKLRITNDSISILGHSAPGDGICLKNYPFSISASNVIVRYIRCRLGDFDKEDNDAITGGGKGLHDVIVDHCSASWSIDECLSLYKIKNLTVQWCLVAQSLHHSIHTKGAHGFGGIWGGNRASFHHNLLASHASRNPRFASDSSQCVDFRNNVIFNWGFKSTYGGGQHGTFNMVKNYYKPGPATIPQKRDCLLDPAVDGTGRFYIAGNVMEGSALVTKDNWAGVRENYSPKVKADTPFSFMPINEDTPENAYRKVLQYSGASFRRDKQDTVIIEQVKTGVVAGKNGGIIDTPAEAGGWPELCKGVSLADSDKDGIPDSWELVNKLNPKDPRDGQLYGKNSKYTNLEIYLDAKLSGMK